MDLIANTTSNKYYCNLHDFNSKSNIENTNNLNILQWNVRGMNVLDKFDEIIYFVNECKFDLDVIVVGETWVKNDYSCIYNIPGYRAYFSCRDNSSGGLAVFIKNNLEHKLINNQTRDGIHHVQIEIKHQGRWYNVFGVYRPPSFDYYELQNIFESWLSTATPSKPVFIVGDVNIPINMLNNGIVNRYKNLLESYGCV